jgi:hypothetical protein
MAGTRALIGVTDTVFFDGGHVSLLCGKHLSNQPFGWKGLDLASLYQGYANRPQANIRDIGIADERTMPHRADQDAILLAQCARVLLFEKMV